MVSQAPTSLLVEPSAPDWAKRLGLRLDKTYQNLYPQQPTRLWDVQGTFPPAADWPGGAVISGGAIYVSDGTSWIKVGPAAPQTDAVTPPQFDNDTSIATTAWVNRVGHQYSRYVVLTGNTVLTAAHAGALLQYAGTGGAAITVTLPPVASMIAGATITVWAGGGLGTLQCAAGDAIYPGFSPTYTSIPIVPGDVVELLNLGTGGWAAATGTLHDWPLRPQFDSGPRLATTSFVQRALGNYGSVDGFAANGTLAASAAGRKQIIFDPCNSVTLPLGSSVPVGACFSLNAAGTVPVTIHPNTGDSIAWGGGSGAIVMPPGSDLDLVHGGSSDWYASGTGLLKYQQQLAGATGNPSWQRFPSGLIMQAGWNQILSGSSVTINLPVAFPNAALNAIATPYSGTTPGVISTAVSTTQIVIYSTVVPQNVNWMAFGS